jgi:hypothetical protein
VTRTEAFTARAATVLNVGHVPKNSRIPRPETTDEAMAICLHTEPGTTIPQNDIDAATKPMAAMTQKALAMALAVCGGREGANQERAGSHAPVDVPRLAQLTTMAMSAPM